MDADLNELIEAMVADRRKAVQSSWHQWVYGTDIQSPGFSLVGGLNFRAQGIHVWV